MPVPAATLEAQWVAATHRHAKVRNASLSAVLRIANPLVLSSDALRKQAQRELQVPGRYWHYGPNEKPAVRKRPWWRAAIQWLFDRWNDLWSAVRKRVHVGRRGQSLVGDGLVLLALLVFGMLGARLIAAVQFRRDDARVALSTLETQRNAHAIYLRAKAAADGGDYNAAVRLLFSAAVTLLDLRGVMHDNASATVNELERELIARGEPIRAPFVELADSFTLAAYAEAAIGGEIWTQAARAYETLSKNAVPA